MVYLISWAYFKQDVWMLQMQIYFNLYEYKTGKTEYINVKIYPVHWFFPPILGMLCRIVRLNYVKENNQKWKKKLSSIIFICLPYF